MGSIELKLSCSFCLRAPPSTQPCRPPTFRSSPSERATDRSHSSRPTIRERGSISAGRASPSVSFTPSPPRERKPRTKREESAYGGGHREERGSESELSGCRAKERETKNGKRKGGKRMGDLVEDPRPDSGQAAKGRETRRELAEPHGRLTIFYCRACRR